MEASINKIEINAEIVRPEIKPELIVTRVISEGAKVLQIPAGASVIGGHLLALIGGRVVHADITNINHFRRVIGFARNSGTENEIIEVVSDGNDFYYPGLNLETDKSYSFDNTGRLATKLHPNAAFYQIVGLAKDTNTFIILLSEPIIRSTNA